MKKIETTASDTPGSLTTGEHGHGVVAGLIARLEAATGPDRGLDNTIWFFVFHERVDAPPFTSSIDAAMTLVPKGWGWVLDYMDPGEPDGAMVGPHICDATTFDEPIPPAIALCIAALKARLATIESQGSPVANSPNNEEGVVP